MAVKVKIVYFEGHHTPGIVQLSSLWFVSVQTAWSSNFWIQPRVSFRQNNLFISNTGHKRKHVIHF